MKLQLPKKTGFGMMIGLLSILILVLAGKCIYYFSSTLSASQCVNFCIEHSNADSTSFASYSDPRYTINCFPVVLMKEQMPLLNRWDPYYLRRLMMKARKRIAKR